MSALFFFFFVCCHCYCRPIAENIAHVFPHSPNHPLNTLLPSQRRLRGCAVNGCSCVVAFFSSVSVYRTFHAVDLAVFKNSHKLKINLHHTTDRHPYIELVRARGLKGVLSGGTTHTKQHDPHIHTIHFPLPPLPALGKQISYRNVCNTKKTQAGASQPPTGPCVSHQTNREMLCLWCSSGSTGLAPPHTPPLKWGGANGAAVCHQSIASTPRSVWFNTAKRNVYGDRQRHGTKSFQHCHRHGGVWYKPHMMGQSIGQGIDAPAPRYRE